MKLERLTTINLQRDARAHEQLAGLRPGQCVHIASMGDFDDQVANFYRDWIREVLNAT